MNRQLRQACASSTWHERRARFNHDFLKNVFKNHMKSMAMLFDQKCGKSLGLMREHLTNDMPTWKIKREEAHDLVDSFLSEASPRSLLDRPPLMRLPPETRSWLGPLVHQLWLARHSIKDHHLAMENALIEMDRAYSNFMKEAEPDRLRSAEDLESIKPHFQVLFDRCNALIIAFENARSANNRILFA